MSISANQNDRNDNGFASNSYADVLITDFENPLFQHAFKQYFEELKVVIKDWPSLFKEINEEGGSKAFVRCTHGVYPIQAYCF